MKIMDEERFLAVKHYLKEKSNYKRIINSDEIIEEMRRRTEEEIVDMICDWQCSSEAGTEMKRGYLVADTKIEKQRDGLLKAHSIALEKYKEKRIRLVNLLDSLEVVNRRIKVVSSELEADIEEINGIGLKLQQLGENI